MDSKAKIYIEFNIFGKTNKREWYINYIPNQDGVDNRILEYFRETYNASLKSPINYQADVRQLESELSAAKEEIERLRLQLHK